MQLNGMELANISGTALDKLREAEKAINQNQSGTMDEVYLIALTKPGK